MINAMLKYKSLYCRWILFFVALQYNYTYAVPPDYCFHQLNKTDCKAKPTPVFYYYQPGARCELALWRGCPTYNKFKNEYECSNTCIYRFRMDYSENLIDFITKPKEKKLSVTIRDFFEDNTTDVDWEEEIKKIPNEDADKIIKIFDDVLSSTYPTTQDDATNLPKLEVQTEVIETTAAGTTALDEANTTEKVDQIPTNDPVTTTSAKLDDTTLMATESVPNATDTKTNIATTNNAITTTNAITTEKIIKTDTTQLTQPISEATSTPLPTTIPTTQGNPDEVDIMRKH